MNTRLTAALAAAAVLATVVFGPAAAEAAPTPTVPAGLCSISDWQNPANFERCIAAQKNALTDTLECLQAPAPQLPDQGIAGWAATRPDASLRGGIGGRYTDHGVAGYQLQTYGLGCTGALAHSEAVAENSAANLIMSLTAAGVGFDNTMCTYAYTPHRLWGWSDAPIAAATRSMYHNVWSLIATLFVVFAGIYMAWRARRGDMNETVGLVAWMLAVAIVVTAIAQWPTRSTDAADAVAGAGLNAVHSVNDLGPQTVTGTKCVLADPDACVDHRTAVDRSSDVVTDGLLYRTWLASEFGSADSKTAQQYGYALYDAQAFTWADAATFEAHPELRKTMIEEKQARFRDVAALVKAQDPEAYEYLQGTHGTDRLYMALVAFLSMLIFSAFDLAASAAIIIGFALFRLIVLTAPLTGAAGVFERTAGMWRRSMNVAVAAGLNIVAFGAGSTVFIYVVDLIYGQDTIPGPLKIVLMAASVVGCWLLIRQVRRVRRVFRTGEPQPDRRSVVDAVLFDRRGTAVTGVPVKATATAGPAYTQPGTAVEVASRAESFRAAPGSTR